MSLLIIGINHNSAPLTVRERVAFAPEKVEEALADGRASAGLDELVILSTCNRTELVAVAPEAEAARRQTLEWLGKYHAFEVSALDAHAYTHVDQEALRHMMQVASGLDSLVLGEPQILGQMKSAYAVAVEAGSVGTELGRVFAQVFNTAKRVRTDTAIGENPVSVAYAAVHLTQHIFTSLAQTTALLVGAGETIELVARHLKERNVGHMIVANRTLERARDLAEQFQAEAILLSEIPEQLPRADIVITSTASQLPLLGKGAVESALKQRKHKPMLMVDIAVPRDIEAEVGDLSDVYLYTVDDLREIVEENRRSRESEARKADEIIAAGVEEYYQQLRALDAVSTVRALRQKVEGWRDAELQRAQRALAAGEAPERVLQQFARSLANKFMHSPSAQLRRASAEGRMDLVAWSQELFELQPTLSPDEDSNS
ncbi:MAG: glutamyl-tRNA reductase [Spongiibacteraceae bacterium]|jgi:glutamyl-tRNA reductase|nr:glutamyl-tRNA reductase [Spongiibacteraceae bacterium]